MTVWAGIDIGNSTTEIVLCDVEAPGHRIVGTGRTPTRGGKGSLRSVEAAARLLRQVAQRHGVLVDRAAYAPATPVHSELAQHEVAKEPTGRLVVETGGSSTTAGDGCGLGTPVSVHDLTDSSPGGSLVVCVPTGVSYRDAAASINAAVSRGHDVVAVLVAADEGVLVANRLTAPTPVVDDADVHPFLGSCRVAVEVRSTAQPLRRLTDPFWLSDAFQLDASERQHARRVADGLRDASCAVVGQLASAPTSEPTPAALTTGGFTVPLAEIAEAANMRRGSVRTDSMVVADMAHRDGTASALDALRATLEIPVTEVASEAEAARAGALTTPGCRHDAVVVDVGGGTIDVVDTKARAILPGAGQLLTVATSAALEISASAAEYAKRGEAVTAVSPHLTEDEHGRRQFLDRPLAGRTVGWLLAASPAGLLPFTARLGSAEWRAWRRCAKRRILGRNVLDGLGDLASDADSVVLTGGGAGDDELAGAVKDELGSRFDVGRADVLGTLGHRYAVAYGVVTLAAAGRGRC